jgi:hypothetical protein
MKHLAPVPDFRPLECSPDLVRVLDKIRFGRLGDDDRYGEFCWFIREYPRIYRHHFDHAEYRLRSIQTAFQHHHDEAAKQLVSDSDIENLIESAHFSRPCSDHSTFVLYWDFECFLQAVGTALDIAARIIGTAFREHTSPNFNQFCKKGPCGTLKEIFVAAQTRWVRKLKAYRDCFTHYTPVDTILSVHLCQYAGVWELRAKLPVNPEAREILRFRYSRRVELLRYAIRTFRHLRAFDRKLAKEIKKLYQLGEYPKKQTGLFHLGRDVDLNVDSPAS